MRRRLALEICECTRSMERPSWGIYLSLHKLRETQHGSGDGERQEGRVVRDSCRTAAKGILVEVKKDNVRYSTPMMRNTRATLLPSRSDTALKDSAASR